MSKNDVSTSMRRHDVASTLIRRCLKVLCLLGMGYFIQHAHYDNTIRERSGSVVECLTRDREAAGSSLAGVAPLWSLSKTHLS